MVLKSVRNPYMKRNSIDNQMMFSFSFLFLIELSNALSYFYFCHVSVLFWIWTIDSRH